MTVNMSPALVMFCLLTDLMSGQRMKARLAELQAKVHQNESQNQNQNQNQSQGVGNGTQTTTSVNEENDAADPNNHRETLKSPVSQPKLVHESVASTAEALYSHSLSDGLSNLNGNGMMGTLHCSLLTFVEDF